MIKTLLGKHVLVRNYKVKRCRTFKSGEYAPNRKKSAAVWEGGFEGLENADEIKIYFIRNVHCEWVASSARRNSPLSYSYGLPISSK